MKKGLVFFIVLILIIIGWAASSHKSSDKPTAPVETIEETAPEEVSTPPPAPASTQPEQEVKYVLEEGQRKLIFWQICAEQDKIDPYDLDAQEKNAAVYDVVAKSWDINGDIARAIAIEGVEKNWPLPEPPP